MDVPRELRRKEPRSFAAKLALQGVALSIVTQLAAFLDAHITQVTLPVQVSTGPRQRQAGSNKRSLQSRLMGCFKRAQKFRTPITIVRETCAQVAQTLFMGQDWVA